MMYLQNSRGQGITQTATHITTNNIARIIIGIGSGTIISNLTITPYVYKGNYDSSTTYEPYHVETQLISLGIIELVKIGDYTDKLFKAVEGNSIYDSLDSTTKASLTSGKWYKQRNIGKVTLNGSESYTLLERTGVNVFVNNSIITSTVYKSASTINIISNYFKGVSDSQGNVENSIRTNATGQLFITIPTSNPISASESAFQTWLNSNNTPCRYILATPTYTEITDTTLISQLNKLEAISLLRGYNYIYTEIASSNVNPYIKLVYIKDLNVVVDELQSFNELLLDQVPIQQVSGDFINVQDSSNLPPKSFSPLGNATQDTNILTYKCVGTETGDYYFVYDNTNYQFTMPTITANELLTFNTTTLKLYQGTTQITTTTASTGTLITMSATPNPDYPQAINVVTGDVTYKQCGKNLFNENISQSSQNRLGVSAFKVTPNTTYSISSSASNFQIINYYKDINQNNLSNTNWNNLPFTFTTPNNCFYLAWLIRKDDNSNIVPSDFTNVQLEINSTATSFEPYHEATQLLSLGSIELAKIGTYTDRIYKSSGKWYVEKNIGKLDLKDKTPTLQSINSYGIANFLIQPIETSVTNNDRMTEVICNRFVRQTTNIANTQTEGFLPTRTTTAQQLGTYIRINSTRADTSANFTTWLTNNPTLYYWALSTPTYTEITDETLISQLENILAMHTNRNVTNASIEPTGTNATPSMVVVYRQDLQILTDKIASLEARVALLE